MATYTAPAGGVGLMGFDYNAAARANAERNRIYQGVPGSNIGPSGVLGMGGDRGAGGYGGSALSDLYGDYRKAYSDANAKNEERYGQVLGMYDQAPGYQPPTLPEARTTGNTAQIGGQNIYGGASAPIYAAQTARVNQDAVSRGIYNTSGALNNASVTNSLALQDAADRTREISNRERLADYDRQYQAYDRGVDRGDMLRREKAGFIERREDVAPDMGLMAQIAMKMGEGSTAGLDAGAFGGGYGGGGGGGMASAASMGYGLPMGAGYWGGGGSGGGSSGGNPYGMLNAAGTANNIAQERLANYRKTTGAGQSGTSTGPSTYVAAPQLTGPVAGWIGAQGNNLGGGGSNVARVPASYRSIYNTVNAYPGMSWSGQKQMMWAGGPKG